jgi:hypothetical protein
MIKDLVIKIRSYRSYARSFTVPLSTTNYIRFTHLKKNLIIINNWSAPFIRAMTNDYAIRSKSKGGEKSTSEGTVFLNPNFLFLS